jgi:hypothetical protein
VLPDNPSLITEGMNTGIALWVNDESMNSILDPKEDQEPWVMLVDLTYVSGNPRYANYSGYEGFFKISPSILLVDIYPNLIRGPLGLQISRMTPQQIWKTGGRKGDVVIYV